MNHNVKVIEGENFVTVEEAENIEAQEVTALLEQLETEYSLTEHFSVLLSDDKTQQVKNDLMQRGYHKEDKITYVSKDLTQHNSIASSIKCRSITCQPESEFLTLWKNTMTGSLNPPSVLDIQEQMKSVKKEIGPSYRHTCISAFEKEEAIGIIMPHIEQGTTDEGRLFYFGLLPEFRGTGRGEELHHLALTKLKEEFGASSYVGTTSHQNSPMLNIFRSNGCRVTAVKNIFKKCRSGQR
ncbi:GNAT family N-acetyltransferase [Halobacillus sp. Marseille-P3879]|uniref:GNAT family N-acetyltransferase n=1 Tax=Halobacillus sp. Marseille-P3879 TaxID=2045014 RepID=UPI000C7E2E6F|nr:GNAT family N-acetyltransferase [Halobacillus sp. Marseille-P3879]